MVCGPAGAPGEALHFPVSRRAGIAALVLLFALIFGLPLAVALFSVRGLAVIDVFYRAGALVFGGGHVVLPLLEAEVVHMGWVKPDAFLAGYGAAQAVPGPLCTFAANLGMLLEPGPNGIAGATLALLAIFLPGFLLLVGALPFWNTLRAPAAYIELKRRYDGFNNGWIGLSCREAAAALHASKDTALRALAELEHKGFIVKAQASGFNMKARKSTEWRLTEYKCDRTGAPDDKAFMRCAPEKKLQARQRDRQSHQKDSQPLKTAGKQ